MSKFLLRIWQFSWGEHPWPELIIWNPFGYFEHLCRCKNVKIYKSLCQWGLERLIKLITTSHPHPWQANRQNLNPAQYHLAILLTIINITVKRPEWIDKRDFKQCFLLFKAFLELLKGEKREGAVPATPFQQSHTCSSGASFARLAGQQGACKRIQKQRKVQPARSFALSLLLHCLEGYLRPEGHPHLRQKQAGAAAVK